MFTIFFFYGLSFFGLGLAAAIESRRATDLPLGKPLVWLAVFGFTHSMVEWIDMFLLINKGLSLADGLMTARIVLLPLSAITLVRFGIGLIHETRPLPAWLNLIPVVLLVPAALLVSYAIIVFATEPPLSVAADVWSRYLLYLPGCLLAAFGFLRQSQELGQTALRGARPLLLGASFAFLLNALAAGLIVPSAPYGLAPWLNYEAFQKIAGFPVQALRMSTALALTVLVLRSMGVFEAEHRQRLLELEGKREQAQQNSLVAQQTARQVAENWTEALVDISRHIANMENADATLVLIVDQARRLLRTDTASLALWDESRQNLILKCLAWGDGGQVAHSVPVKSSLIRQVAGSMKPFRYPEDLNGQRGQWVCPLLEQEIRAAAIVPLQLDGTPVGGLWAGRFEHVPFTQTDLVGLARLADQAVIAIEHALMASHLQSLAVFEERSRIAREMHDGLAQLLGYLNLELQTLAALVERGNPEAVLRALTQARARVLAAQDDVRENILSLRTTLAGHSSAVTALQEYVQEFGLQTGIDALLEDQVGDRVRLSPLAETQLVCIVQEALTNIRKHARAGKVLVRLGIEEDLLIAVVMDDGIGLAPQADRNHFGLATMQERAESVGGQLQIDSTPMEGTTVTIRLPLIEENGSSTSFEPLVTPARFQAAGPRVES